MEDKLPIYSIVMDEETQGLDFVSFVADPAIMEMGLAFSNTPQKSFKFNKDKQVVVGPAMIADLPLYREIDGEGFYVVFTKEVIEQLVEKFNRDSISKKINVDHADVVESAFIKSNWIKEDMKHDKSLMYGFENIPVGSWFIEVKVDDSKFWENEIKAGGKFGFSVEGIFGLNYQEFNKNKKQEEMNVNDLSPEELELINKFRAGNVTESFEEVKEEEEEEVMAEEEVKEEEEVEAAEEGMEPEMEPEAEAEQAMDEEAIMALVQPKFDEVISMIAELKSMIEGKEVEVEEETPAQFNKLDAKTEAIKAFRSKFSN